MEAGSPWENPFAESSNVRLRDEFLNIELFSTVQEARPLVEQHQIAYNIYRPHSMLQGVRPWSSSSSGERLDYPPALRGTGAGKGGTSAGRPSFCG
ncbi:MAG: integrase core domain-containing protein [Prochlorococcaceae cyanobacterium]